MSGPLLRSFTSFFLFSSRSAWSCLGLARIGTFLGSST